jgi:hypothetical protein
MILHFVVFILYANRLLVDGGIINSNIDKQDRLEKLHRNDIEERYVDTGIGSGRPLDDTDYTNGNKINTSVSDGEDPIRKAIENGNEFEGDIKLNTEQAAAIRNGTKEALMSLRAASTINYHKWTKSGSTVSIPYVISSSFSSTERANIARALSEFQSKTCIRIVPRSTQVDYVSVYKGSGCSSYVGRQGGVQYLSLGGNCASSVGVIIHEFMHAVGYWHEQSRSDRDSYIVINWSNIQSGMEFNFQKCSSCTTQGHSYDVQSVMHYSNYAFSNGRGPTITRRDCPTCSIGQRSGFSTLDVKGINTLYSCSDGGSSCVDSHQYCSYWAGQGYCNYYYVAWMRTNCKKSCGVC